MNASPSPTGVAINAIRAYVEEEDSRPSRNPDLYSDIPSSIIPPHRQKKNSAKNIVSNMNVPAALPATNLR